MIPRCQKLPLYCPQRNPVCASPNSRVVLTKSANIAFTVIKIHISLLAEQICFLKVRSWRGRHFFLRNRVGYRLEDPTMQQKPELGLKQGCSELQQSASLTNHGTAPGQAAQSQQPQHRQLGWQGRGLSYGLHFVFAKRLVSPPPLFFLSNQFKSFITMSICL